MKEAEFTHADGTVRKAHYGAGRQPWDDILEKTDWAVGFCAGNVFKYVRRAAAKNGEDDIRKAQWYLARLQEMAASDTGHTPHAQRALMKLATLLTDKEHELLGRPI